MKHGSEGGRSDSSGVGMKLEIHDDEVALGKV